MHISDNLFEITSRVETIEFARFDNGKKNSSRHSSSLGVSSVPSLAANDRVYINNRCTFPHLENLFAAEEITKEVEAAIPGIPKVITALQKTAEGSTAPKLDIGPHCADPYECPFTDHCWKERGITSPSIFELPGIGRKAWTEVIYAFVLGRLRRPAEP